MVESFGLRSQVPVLATAGVKLSQGLEPSAQLRHLGGPGVGGCLPLLERLGGLPTRLVGPRVTTAQGGVLGATQGVQSGALGCCRAQPQLIGLTVDGDQSTPHLVEDRGRDGTSSQVGAGTTGGRDSTRHQEKVVIEVCSGLEGAGGGARVGVDQEGPFDQDALGTRTHAGGLCTLPQQQPQ